MTIKEELREAMKIAMKEKNKERLLVIRSLLAAFQYEEMARGKEELGRGECLATLQREIKRRQESIEFATQAGRSESVKQDQLEIAIIQDFLPKQLSNEEIRDFFLKLVGKDKELKLSDLLKALRAEHDGEFEGKIASEIGRNVLQGE